jgi:hypothetical protein
MGLRPDQSRSSSRHGEEGKSTTGESTAGSLLRSMIDETVKSPSLDFLLTETEKCDFRFPYKSKGCAAPR